MQFPYRLRLELPTTLIIVENSFHSKSLIELCAPITYETRLCVYLFAAAYPVDADACLVWQLWHPTRFNVQLECYSLHTCVS